LTTVPEMNKDKDVVKQTRAMTNLLYNCIGIDKGAPSSIRRSLGRGHYFKKLVCGVWRLLAIDEVWGYYFRENSHVLISLVLPS
jgi:hypothetical protein